MVNLPEDVSKIVNDPSAIKVLATKAPDGEIHVIRVGSIFSPEPGTIAFGAILMKRTAANLEAMKLKNERPSVLVSSGTTSFEIKCSISQYITSGPLFEKMNEELKKMGLQARGVWTLGVKEVWNQSASYEAGKKIA
jgi:hypothetical protein